MKSLTVSRRASEDKLIWGPTKNDIFLVKATYFIECQMKKFVMGETSAINLGSTAWNKIWDLQVPNVVKDFMWKVVSEILPTKINLFRSKITNNDLCPICEQHEETSSHILWNCAVAQDVWADSSSILHKWKCTNGGFYNIWEDLVLGLQKSEIE